MDIRPLRCRDFRILMTSGVVTMFGSFITIVAVPYQIMRLTDSYLAVGAIGVVELVPMVLGGLWGGALADAMDRRRVIVLCEIGMAVLAAGLLVNALLPDPAFWPLYICAGGIAALDGLQRPSLNALIPRLMKRDEMAAANAIQGMRWQIGSIAGPALGGLLVTQVGIAAAYAVDLATFVVSFVLLAWLRPAPAPPGAERPSIKGIVVGVRYAFSRQELMGTYVVDIAAMFFAMPMALFPFVADDLRSPSSLGLFYAATSVGALAISLTSGWVRHVHRHGTAVLIAAGVWGAAVVGFGLASDVATALVFLVVAGAADMVSGLFRQTMWNQTIPDELRGRLAGIELLSFSIGPTLGQMRAGGMAAAIGLRGSIVSGGLLCVGACGALARVLPRFTAYDERTSPHGRAETTEPVQPADPGQL
ncbi:MFS transporter [Streptomyces sp. SID3343]|uniref:MFS transporter n=1 Tax=Streptomyces sp. SID3343 TaxID=2690260 RepID=UPI00136A0C42|nr:MFS transporter [Streptomyces sp. SID3343]MYV99152.1 MFS transporter [Streptomyces sp. SID3343]